MRPTKTALSLVLAAVLLPGSLSQNEAQEGWILLHDGETTTGWAGDSAAFISGGGVLSIDGQGLLRSQSPFADFILRFDVKAYTPQSNAGLIVRANREGAPKDTGYEIQLGSGDSEWPYGSIVGQTKATGALATGTWISMEVEANGGNLKVSAGGRVVASASGLQGTGGLLVIEANKSGKVEIRNPRLKPLNPQTLFNGTDLSGWKSTGTVPKQSGGIGKMLGLGGKGKPKEVKWTVGGGSIHGEEGPGQLENLLPMGDFLFQADVRLNSKKNENKRRLVLTLRGDPGQLGTGYEVNLQPGQAGGVAPLAGSKKASGKVNQFATVTVSAYNRHFQVWVDGVLTADADDVRAEGTNPKKEARTTPGSVAFYSPDEEANLDIRNVKAVQLPKVLGHVRQKAPVVAKNEAPAMTLPAAPIMPSAPPPAAGGGNDQQIKLLQEQMNQQKADKQKEEQQKQQVKTLQQQALNTNDPAAQLSLYDQILNIDPNNQIAFNARREAKGKLDADQAKRYEESQKQEKEKADLAQKEKDFQNNLDKAQTAFLAGNLVAADTALSAAERVFPNNPAVVQIRTRLDAARGRASSIFTLGAAGLGTAVLAGLAWLFMARGKKDPYILITAGLDKGKKFNIDGQVMKLGAIAEDGGQKNDVVLRDAERMVSRFHAEIHYQNGKLYVIDANSSNGTFVDKKRIAAGKPVQLAKGSLVSFGGTCAVKIGFEKRSKDKKS